VKVITYSKTDLKKAAEALLKCAVEDGFMPDLIVGIETGGRELGALIAESIFPPLAFGILKCQRVMTGMKRRWRIGAILKLFPYFVTDKIRIMEHNMRLQWKARIQTSAGGRCISKDNLNKAVLKIGWLERPLCVLIVDDAVDSGETLRVVLEYVRNRIPDADIKTASLTVTCLDPLIVPNYAIYKGDYLVRFPWSEDYRG
jgi:uncharacterized protein